MPEGRVSVPSPVMRPLSSLLPWYCEPMRFLCGQGSLCAGAGGFLVVVEMACEMV